MGTPTMDEKTVDGEFIVSRDFKISNPGLSGTWKVLGQMVVDRGDGLKVVVCKIQTTDGKKVAMVTSDMLKKVHK